MMLAYWTYAGDPFLIKFPSTWPIAGIRWYGFAYFFSFVLAYFFLQHWGKIGKIKLNSFDQQNLLFALFCGIIFGGRLGFVFFYQWPYYAQHLWDIFKVWEGGMSAHGAFIGIACALLIFSRKTHWPFFSIADLVIPLGCLGIFFGRCANFINSEVYGRVTQVPWGVIFQQDCFVRHPSQLYEALGEGLCLFIWSLWRFKDPRIVRYPGLLASQFLVLYGLLRILLECFREPDAPLIFLLSRGQFYSIWAVFLGFSISYYVKKHSTVSASHCVFQR